MTKLASLALLSVIVMFIVIFSGGADKGFAFIGSVAKWLFGMGLIAFVIYQIDAYSKNSR